MLHLNPGVEGLVMPPDCVKSGILDSDGLAPVGREVCKDSRALMVEPGRALDACVACYPCSRFERVAYLM